MWPLHQQITEPGEQESQQKALKEQLGDLPCLSPMGQRHPRGSRTGMGPGGQHSGLQATPPTTDMRGAGPGMGLQTWAAAAATATSVTVGERTLDPQVMSAW